MYWTDKVELCQKILHFLNHFKTFVRIMLSFTLLSIIFRQHGSRDGSRIFVALFDYDPPTMSPNPEACDEELPFREGQLIKV
jgi:hypothetical protein